MQSAESYSAHLGKIGRRYLFDSLKGDEKERLTFNEQRILTGLLIREERLPGGLIKDFQFSKDVVSECFIANDFINFVNDFIIKTMELYRSDILEILSKFSTPESAYAK